MASYETVKLKRDCEASQIPSGAKILLPEGMEVRISQSLGGSFTVITDDGFMVRIAAEDAAALGKESSLPTPSSKSAAGSNQEQTVEHQIWEALRTCYDPEIPVNIVDLGLIYLCRVTPLPEGGSRAQVQMTLTAPGCGMGEVLRADAQGKILRIPGIKQADIELVWSPPWDQSRMSEAAKLQLGIL